MSARPGRWGICLLALLWTASRGSAQPSATLVGTVLDQTTGEPVPGALVLLDDGTETWTDARGRYRLRGVSPGRVRVAAVARGCRVALGELEVAPGEAVRVILEVIAPGDDGYPGALLWEPREGIRGTALKTVTGREIREMGAGSLLEVVRAVAPQMVHGAPRYPGEAAALSGRARNSVFAAPTPVVIVDGIRIEHEPERALAEIDPSTVARVEILQGPAGAWIHGAGGANGVVRVFTRRSGRWFDPETDPRACGFSFPEGGP